MKKLLVSLFLVLVIFLPISTTSFAAPKVKGSAAVSNSAKIKVGTKLAKGILNVTFSNLTKAKKISYELTYKRGGVAEGVSGSVSFKGKGPVTKKITLGTCSGKVCVYHKKVSNIRLKVTTKYASGGQETKTYNVK